MTATNYLTAPLLAMLVFAWLESTAAADAPAIMMAKCRNHAHDEFQLRLPDIETEYEGQRVDGTHAVNGTAYRKKGNTTFQCTFDKSGTDIVKFVVN